MKRTLPLLLIVFLLQFKDSFAQITCDPSGNVVIYSNYDGGVLNINVDVNIPNLKIGIVSYEMVTINLTGPFVNNITEVQFAGYTTTPNHHCANSPAVTSIVGAPAGTDTLVFMPTSPITNNNGYYIIICNYSCDTTSNQGGCNTPDQIAAYFQQEFGGLLRYHFTQYGCWNGTYNISDGGNCCVSTLSPAPVALFSAINQLCPGTCTDFINLSTNATSWQWFFPGANPSSSTDENPTGICYNTPGNYDVTLIATGPGGVDTIQLNNYITVFPYPLPQGIMQVGDTLFANPGAVSYQWYFNGNLIPGATDYFFVTTSTGFGDYNVVATDVNGCEVEAAFYPSIGVPDLSQEEGVILSPNPAIDLLELKNLAEEASIKIYSLVGQLIKLPSTDCKPPICLLDVSTLPRGSYLIEIVSEKRISRNRFVKQ